MSGGRNYIAEELHAKDAEIERLQAARDRLYERNAKLAGSRNAIIEECAKVAETWSGTHYGKMRELDIAAAIRALKDKP